jgi:predicted peptidase
MSAPAFVIFVQFLRHCVSAVKNGGIGHRQKSNQQLNESKNITLILLFLLLLGCEERPGPGKQVLVKNNVGNKIVDSYWLYLPSHYNANRKWPVILFLQGQGVISRDPSTCKNDGPVAYRNSAVGSLVNEFIIVNPHMKIGQIEERQWPQYSSTLIEIVNDVSRKYNGDSSRFYLTGLSLGASGTWGIAKSNPDFFAAIVPISGALACNSGCENLVNQNIWIIHNKKDNNISYTYADEAVRQMEQMYETEFLHINTTHLPNRDFKSVRNVFSLSESSGHDAWSDAYTSPDLYNWLLSKQRIKRP